MNKNRNIHDRMKVIARGFAQEMDALENKPSELGNFLKKTEPFIEQMFDLSRDVAENLRSVWIVLDGIYAVALDRDESPLKYESYIASSIADLKNILRTIGIKP